ncbi:MAG TPA: hypothetical protein VLX91_03925 [Candidatus Acidoferrales bacterium]|nr:hypothetical protein [Candidatus Acidoferrales bacterium]
MPNERFRLSAEISTSDTKKIEPVLTKVIGVNGIIRTEKGFKVKTTIEGQSATELNLELLSALKRVEKETVLRAKWTTGRTTEWFIDYVLKGVTES